MLALAIVAYIGLAILFAGAANFWLALDGMAYPPMAVYLGILWPVVLLVSPMIFVVWIGGHLGEKARRGRP